MDKDAIVGGVIGGTIAIFAICVALFFFVRHRRMKSRTPYRFSAVSDIIIDPFDANTLSNGDSSQSPTTLIPHLVSNIHDTPPVTRIVTAPTVPIYIPQVSGLYEKQVRYGQVQRSDERSASANFVEHTGEDQRGSAPSAGTSSGSRVDDPDLRRVLEDLRREVVRIRQEREVVDEAPPLYDYEIENTMRR